MRNTKPLLSALAVAAIGAGITACNPASLTSAAGGLGSSSGTTTSVTTGPGKYILQSMPTGTVTISRSHGTLLAQVAMFGLTPNSSHSVYITNAFGHAVRFTTLTADGTGQADATLTSLNKVGHVPLDGRLVIQLGDSTGDPVAAEPIAETSPLFGSDTHQIALHAVTVDSSGERLGSPAGVASLAYNASAQTLTITVTAAGLQPGPHAAHIHLGSCQSQGAVKYMLPDFVADSHGAIVDQTRVVTGVTSVPGPGSWYLNLHMGGMNQILANGSPTLFFRPMLCTNITSFAVTGSASPSASASVSSSPSMSSSSSPSPSAMPSMTSMPSASASASSSASASASATPSSSSPVSPGPQPTHW